MPPTFDPSMAVRMVGSTGMMAPVMRCRSTNRSLQGRQPSLHACALSLMHLHFISASRGCAADMPPGVGPLYPHRIASQCSQCRRVSPVHSQERLQSAVAALMSTSMQITRTSLQGETYFLESLSYSCCQCFSILNIGKHLKQAVYTRSPMLQRRLVEDAREQGIAQVWKAKHGSE